PHVKNVIRASEMAGARIGGLVYGPLAASRAALSKHQKNLGVVVIDMGASTTGIAVYEEHKLLGVGMIPLGADNITKDLAVGLKIPVHAAEALKLRHGYALAKDVNQKEEIDLKKFSPDAQGVASRRYIASIIEARLAEILELVNNELKLLGKARELAGGVILTGGGAKLPGLAELARSELKLASQVGCTIEPKWAREGLLDGETSLQDPEFVNAMGLLFWGADEEEWWPSAHDKGFDVRRFLESFIP
ncbi:MAG: cell division FtsA domain-containing protein, partial [bacterium]|nr:cell division FtsA domain-containing protein [bacterium]